MKALCVKQPWAQLIVDGYKDVENRTWQTAYRGPILICASKKPDYAFTDILAEWNRIYNLALTPKDFPLGGVVGQATLIDIVTDSDSDWFDPGAFGWVLGNAAMYEFMPVKGRLGLFDLELPHEPKRLRRRGFFDIRD